MAEYGEQKDKNFDFRARMKNASEDKSMLKETLLHTLLNLLEKQRGIDTNPAKLEEVKGYSDGGAGHRK